MCALKFRGIVAAEAKKREYAGKPYTHVGVGSETGETDYILARQFNVGKETIKRADKVRKQGTRALVATV